MPIAAPLDGWMGKVFLKLSEPSMANLGQCLGTCGEQSTAREK